MRWACCGLPCTFWCSQVTSPLPQWPPFLRANWRLAWHVPSLPREPAMRFAPPAVTQTEGNESMLLSPPLACAQLLHTVMKYRRSMAVTLRSGVIMMIIILLPPSPQVSIYGLVTIQAFYLPFAFMAITVLMGGSPIMDVFGIAAGHIWYFFTDLYPRSSGRWVLVRCGMCAFGFVGLVCAELRGGSGGGRGRGSVSSSNSRGGYVAGSL